MHISDKGLELLKASEGFRNRVYKDVAGFDTIGYGHLVLPCQEFPDGISEEDASGILAQDVAYAEHSVNALVKVPISQGQFDALVDFVFNLGARSLAYSTLLMDLNMGNYDAAAQQLQLWDHAGHVEVAGLHKRRQAEYALWYS